MSDQEHPLISFIVPIYNTEQYLPECIESVMRQTSPDWELLLVDDGSTDNSGRICDKYSKKNDRIRVIHKENEGQFATRQQGIAYAKGEYCTGLDSDDYIDGNCVETIKEYINTQKYDIISWNMRMVRGGTVVSEERKERYGEFSNTEFLEYVIRSTDHSFCNKLIKTSLLKAASYGDVPLSARHSEDYIMICPAICMSKRVLAIDATLYNYRQTEDTVTHSYSGQRVIDYLDSTTCVFDILERYYMLSDEIRVMEYSRLVSTVGYCIKRAFRDQAITKREIRQIKTHPIYRDLKKYEKSKYTSKDLILVMKLFRCGFDGLLNKYYGGKLPSQDD